MTTPRRAERQAALAVSLSRATPKRRVPRKLVHDIKKTRVETTSIRCINVRYRHGPRPIQERDLCPACDEDYLNQVGWKEGLSCPNCGWFCKGEQPVG